MMRHLGGTQSRELILAAHRRYQATAVAGQGCMFKILVGPSREVAGSVGYWETTWGDEPVYETGWGVFPEHQGRGIAGRAAALVIARARSEKKRRFVHAFPPVTNIASSAICRTLGFTNLGECDFEYPRGHALRCHDWCLDLFANP